MLRDLTPPAAAYAAHCTPDNLRDWRRKGFLNEIGERDGREWRYSRSETTMLATARELLKCGFPLRLAFAELTKCADRIHIVVASALTDAEDTIYSVTLVNAATHVAPEVQRKLENQRSATTPGDPVLHVNVSDIARDVARRLADYDRNPMLARIAFASAWEFGGSIG